MSRVRLLIVALGIGVSVTCTSAFSGGNGMMPLGATKKKHDLASSYLSWARFGGNTLTMSARQEHPECSSDALRMPRRPVIARVSAMALLLSGTKRVVAEAGPVYLLFCLVYPCLDDLMPRLVLAHGRRVRAIQQAETRAGGQTRSGEPESQRKPRGRWSSDAAALFYVSTSTLLHVLAVLNDNNITTCLMNACLCVHVRWMCSLKNVFSLRRMHRQCVYV